MEDFLGDMDMKVASTSAGITAIQADIKIHGLPIAVVRECFERADAGNKQILQKMTNCISTPRTERKPCWPMSKVISVEPIKNKFFKNDLNLKKFLSEQNVSITEIEPFKYHIFAPSKVAAKVDKTIEDFLATLNVPKLKHGEVRRVEIVEVREDKVVVKFSDSILPFYVSVQHLSSRRAANPTVLGFEVGQQIFVICNGFHPETGDPYLSRKELYFSNK